MPHDSKREQEEIVAAVIALLATRGGGDDEQEQRSRWRRRGLAAKPWSRDRRMQWRDRARRHEGVGGG